MARRKQKKVDLEINRYGMFMNENSFDLDVMYGRHFLDTDVNFLVRIHRINIIESKTHDLYGQSKAKDRKYFPPIEIQAMVDIGDNEQNNYGEGEGGIAREDSGDLILKVYLDELEEKNMEVNRGDIIEYNLSGDKSRYYEVENAHNVTDSTSQTIASFKPYWKRIVSHPVKEDVTPYLMGDSLT